MPGSKRMQELRVCMHHEACARRESCRELPLTVVPSSRYASAVNAGPYTFRVRGARGTIACSGREFLRYGGNTSCFSLETPEGFLIVDAGTGISSVATDIAAGRTCARVVILFTHFHIDHVIGLTVFSPLYTRGTEVTMMGDPGREGDWKASLRGFLSKPYWPVGLGDGNGALRLQNLPVRKGTMSCMGAEVSWFGVPHPQGCLAYRLAFGGMSVVISTDTEYVKGNVDPAFIAFCTGADALVFDSQFTPREYPSHVDWGHSTWEVAAETAAQAQVKRLILTHHAPSRSDRAMDAIVRDARSVFRNTDAAFEGMVLAGPRRRKAAGNPSPGSTGLGRKK